MSTWKKNQCTLADRIVYLIGNNATNSREFQIYLKIFGKEKIEQMWQEGKPAPKSNYRIPIEKDEEVV